MTGIHEQALWIDCEGTPMLGILSSPLGSTKGPTDRPGVLIVVGGPQYRVGSHRQFTLLARRLAAHGYPTLRFDYRGMGDSHGEPHQFTQIAPDIAAAASALQSSAMVSGVVLWGLCDAASAILLSVHRMPGVLGLVLVNPWARSVATHAATRLKHYYAARVWNRDFWLKVLGGRLDWRDTLASMTQTLQAALDNTLRRSARAQTDDVAYQTRMANSLRQFRCPVLLALSGNDLTAKEFVEYTSKDPAWRGVLARAGVSRAEHPDADHTFSCALWRGWLEDQTLALLDRLPAARSLRAPAQPIGVAQ
jgi:exosortase A-associated hydrolase 1